MFVLLFFFFKQKTAYEMRISDWSSDVCSSDLNGGQTGGFGAGQALGAMAEIADRAGLRAIGADAGFRDVEINLHDPPLAPDRFDQQREPGQIGRASCRERVCQYVWISVVAGYLKKKQNTQNKKQIRRKI